MHLTEEAKKPSIGRMEYKRLKIQISDIESEGELQDTRLELRKKFKACPEFQIFNNDVIRLLKMKVMELRIRRHLITRNKANDKLNEQVNAACCFLKVMARKGDGKFPEIPTEICRLRAVKNYRMRTWREKEMELLAKLQSNYLNRSTD